MSDYLGALIRSAGFDAVPVVRLPASQPVDDDPLEQAAPREIADPTDAYMPGMDGLPHHAQNDASIGARGATLGAALPAEAPRGAIRPAPEAADPHLHNESAHRPDPPPAATASATAPPARATVAGATMHPVVQAALRWVAADPALRQVPARAEGPRAADPMPGSNRPSRDSAERFMHDATAAMSAAPSAPLVATPGTAAPAPSASAHRPPAADLGSRAAATYEAAPIRFAAATKVLPAAPQAESKPAPEVHIGSIHVTVDAPRPPPAPPVPAPARPTSAARGAAPRSAYLRSRAPRI